MLLALLGAVFLKGFTEAIGVAVVLVGVYLALNVVVVADGAVAGCSASREPRHRLDRRPDAAATATRCAMVGGVAAGLPQAGARPVRLRDRRRGHAAREGAARATPRSGRPAVSRAPDGC